MLDDNAELPPKLYHVVYRADLDTRQSIQDNGLVGGRARHQWHPLWAPRPGHVYLATHKKLTRVALMDRADIHDDATMRLFIANGKGGKHRWVPLTQQLLDILNEWGMPESGRLWPYEPQQLSRAVNDFLHHEVDTESTCHALRHHYATKVYQETHDIRLVQILLGHASIATTQIYAQADMSTAADAVMRAFAPKAIEPIEIGLAA